MEPITVAVIGDDEHALQVRAKLQDLDPSKIIVVGAMPVKYEYPYALDAFDIHPAIGPLKITEPDVPFVSNKMIGLLRRAGVVIESNTNDDAPQRG
ncbi:hypothetical protein D3C81_270690 [compost metagenome]